MAFGGLLSFFLLLRGKHERQLLLPLCNSWARADLKKKKKEEKIYSLLYVKILIKSLRFDYDTTY